MADTLLLNARVSADLSSFQRELARGPALARTFGRDVSREVAAAFQAPRVNVQTLGVQGTAAGRAFVDGMARQMDAARPFATLTQQANAAAVAIAGVWGVREAVQAADAWQSAANRLALVTGSAEEARRAQEQLFRIAQDTRAAFAGTVEVYTRFARAAQGIGASQRDVLAVTTAINQSLAISGASADAAQAALVQLGQGLAAGALRGEELNSVLEQAPRLAQAIADGLGVGVGQLRELGAAGSLTSERVFAALVGQADRIGAEFEQMAPTIGQAFQQVENAATRFIGTTSQMTGAGRAISTSLAEVAEHFDTIANAAVVVGGVFGARAIGAGVDRLVQGARQQAAALGEQQRAIVQTTFAENAHAQAIAQTAAADVRQTEQRIANLRRIQVEQERAIALERQRLAAAAETINRAQAVPVQQLAPLGGAVVERELRARAEAERVATQASNRILLLDEQRERTARALGAETARLATAQQAATAATNLAAVANARHTAAIAGTTLAARTGALAIRGLQTALAFFGGPIGAAITGVSIAIGLIATRTTAAEQAARKYADELSKIRREAEDAAEAIGRLNDDQRAARRLEISEQIREVQSDLADLRDDLRGTAGGVRTVFNAEGALEYNRAIGDVRRQFLAGQISAEQFAGAIGRIEQQFPQFGEAASGLLEQVRAFQAAELRARSLADALEELNLAGRPQAPQGVAPAPFDIGRIQGEVQQLARLRDTGNATADEYRRIAEIVRQARAELGRLATVPQTDATRAARVQLQEALDALTGETRAGREIRAGIRLDTREAERQIADLVARARTLIEATTLTPRVTFQLERDDTGNLQSVARTNGAQLLQLALRRAEVEQELNRQLGMQTDQFGEQAIQLRRMLADLERAQSVGSQLRPLAPIEIPTVVTAPTVRPSDDLVRRAQEGTNGALAQGRQEARRFRIELDGIATGARGVTQVADAFGRIDDDLRRAIDGAAGLLDGIAGIRAEMTRLGDGSGFSDLFGSVAGVTSIISAIGGAAGLISGLFNQGPSPVALALRSNEDALERLRAELRDVRATFANLSLGADVSGAIAANLGSIRAGGFMGAAFADRGLLDAELARLGTSFAGLSELADQFGVSLVDAEGRVLLRAFDQLAQALVLAREAALRWDATTRGIADRISARNDIFDIDATPAQQFADAVAILRAQAPTLADLFTGIDVGTQEGRALAETTLRNLFRQIDQADPLALLRNTGFESLDEFVDVLLSADNALDSFTDATSAATAAMLGVPSGFRRQLAEWASTLPTVPQASPTPQPYTAPTSYTPGRDRTDTVRDEGRTRAGDTYHITITVPGAHLTADEVIEAAERAWTERARATGGARAASQVTFTRSRH